MKEERFEEIFEEVMKELELCWWELFDSDDFEIVVERVEDEFGAEVLESEEWKNWVHEMAEEL